MKKIFYQTVNHLKILFSKENYYIKKNIYISIKLSSFQVLESINQHLSIKSPFDSKTNQKPISKASPKQNSPNFSHKSISSPITLAKKTTKYKNLSPAWNPVKSPSSKSNNYKSAKKPILRSSNIKLCGPSKCSNGSL